MALIPPIIIFWGPYEQLWELSHVPQARLAFWTTALATTFFVAFYLFQGTMEIFTPSGRVDWSEGFRPGMMRPQLFSASLLLGLIPITAGLAVFRLLIWGDFLEFISPAHPEGAAALERILLAGWSPTSLLLGIGAAIAGWATAFYFHVAPVHAPAWWAERKKTFYLFFLNQGYFDEVYKAMIIRPYLRFASWLWQNVDVRLIDRPASGLVNAADKMGTRVAKVFGGETDVKPGVPYAAMRLLMVLLVFLLFLLGVAERIEIYFLS
jgi:NADH:ubiquinone oxidoreductase subunit 5 (subunit L)/multisubunit Na+/H+ antiporter MnhA subunit